MKNLVRALRAMADEPRMTILSVLSIRGAVCVSHLQEAMKTPQPTVSRYLSILRNAGLLESERRGQWVYYSLNHDDGSLVIEMIQRASEQLKESAKIKRIMERLDKLEQQPPLTEEATPATTKVKPKSVKRVHRKREKDIAEVVMEEEPIAEAAASSLKEEEAPRAAESIGIAQPVQDEGSKQIEPVASENLEEAEAAETALTEQSVEGDGKKRTRKKKQQLPSLFDL